MSLHNAWMLAAGLLLTTATPTYGVPNGYQYLHPIPDSKYVPSETTLIVRFESVSPDRIRNLDGFISVSGGTSGAHPGRTRIASDGKTVLFTADDPFIPGETVTVALDPDVPSQRPEFFRYTFKVIENSTSAVSDSDEAAPPLRPDPGALKRRAVSQPATFPNGVSVPSDFPYVEVTVNDNPAPGYIFIDNRGGGPGRPYNVIFDNDGNPVWYDITPAERRDPKVQANGWFTMMIRGGYGGGGWGFIALNDKYEHVKTFRATNGYSTDEHELQVLEDGGWLVIGRRDIHNFDMTAYGGQANATVRETCIQEYTADGELPIFQWAALDHFDIGDTEGESLTASYIRFPHMNSIDIDEDGHIILSSRHLSEITKINRNTGEIIWRLGGANNQFTYINDPLQGTRNQHDARVLGGGVYSAFDNGDLHNPPVSRAVKYRLDTNAMTAELIWEYRENGWFSQHMSNAQQLPNGNMLINWGQSHLPKATEIRPDKSKAFQMDFVYPSECYRVHRCVWNGKAEAPVLEIEPQVDNITLIFNKFGDPDVDYYRIYSDRQADPTTLLDTSRATMKHIRDLGNGYHWFRVTAVNRSGQESGFSNQEQVYVNFTTPGENLVTNGDFSDGQNGWTWELQGSGNADWSVQDGAAVIDISNGGDNVYDVQLRQNGIPLIQGNTYVFEFEARAAAPRTIEAKVGQDVSPWANYSQLGPTFITQAPQTFSYEFDMDSPSDGSSRVVFNCGQADNDVILDNIRVSQKSEQASFIGSPHPIPGTIQCEEYDVGGEGIAYHDDGSRDGDPEYRPDDNVDVQAASDVDGGYNVGWTEAGEWLEYTVNAEPGVYDIEYRTASDPGGGQLEVVLDGRSLATFAMTSTGDWQTYETKTQSDIEIAGGENLILRLNILEGDQNMNWLRFVQTSSAVDDDPGISHDYALLPNFPNPFNPETRIDYRIPEDGHVRISVFNVLGERVAVLEDGPHTAGGHHVMWDGRSDSGASQASGLYIVRMHAGPFQAMRKITLLR